MIDTYTPRDTKTRIFIGIILSLVLYIFGLKFLLLPSILLALVLYMPMPKIFNSWVSRVFVAFLLAYSLIQVAALLQFIIFPGGRFRLIAAMVAVLVMGMVQYFGHPPKMKDIPIFSIRDAGAVLGCVFFVVSFFPVLTKGNTATNLTRIGSVQVVDAISHFGAISGLIKIQNLDYASGRYYPLGFHVATAFTEHSLLGNINNSSWMTHVTVYFLQYILFGVLLGYGFVYFGYQLLELLEIKSGKLDTLFAGIVLGVALTIMHLWLFVNDGFINYLYICCAVLVSILYILDAKLAYIKTDMQKVRAQYIWPIFAYLLLGFGITFSWSILTPIVLLGAVFLIVPDNWKQITQDIRLSVKVYAPIVLIVLVHCVAFLLQAIYLKNGGQLLNAYGALQHLNTIFLLIGILALTIWIYINRSASNNRFLAVLTPYILMVVSLVGLQLISFGEVRYYAIKTSIILEIIFLAIIIALIIYWVNKFSLTTMMKYLYSGLLIFMMIFGMINLQPYPFQEVRAMFRDISGVPKPQHFENDTKAVAYLGARGQLHDFNMTILHYDAEQDRFYGHISTALWAHAMTSSYQDAAMQISGSKSGTCFGKQVALLFADSRAPKDKQALEDTIRECITNAKKKGQTYYIVSDGGSRVGLEQKFGKDFEIIY